MAALLTVASTAGAAVIYKWTDANGVVHYSDQEQPGAEKMVISGSTSRGAGGPVRSGAAGTLKPPGAPATQVQTLSIVSPSKEQVFFNDQVVAVRAELQPELRPQQVLTWQLNGATLTDQGQNALSFSLPTLPRGSYTLNAIVTDVVTGASLSADAVTFYVRQPSELAPLRRR